MSIVLHLIGVLQRCVSTLLSALNQHAVPVAAIVECTLALNTGLFHALQPLATKTGLVLMIAQPTQLMFSLRSAMAQLGSPPQQALVISLTAAPATLLAAAAGLQCSTLHIPPSEPASFALLVLQHFAQLMRSTTGCLVAGYLMKHSRQLSLVVQGMLPLLPQDGLCFMPVDLSQDLATQQPFDILLQKPTDYLEEVPGSGKVPGFTTQMTALNVQLSLQPRICVVDPLAQVHTVVDRAALAVLLDGVCQAAQQAGIPLRSPKWVVVQGVGRDMQQQLALTGMQLPIIVKPQVACGVSEAHQMALLLHLAGLHGLGVPMPAVAQEYIDHGGMVWKVYVAGDKVFKVQRKSTPDLQPLVQHAAANPDAGVPSRVDFDSLKSLPTTLPWAQQPEQLASARGGQHSRQLLHSTAALVSGLLHRQLQLTLFGFDIVVTGTGELVIIDVNFFPSFKGIPEAPQALRTALLAKHREHLAGLAPT